MPFQTISRLEISLSHESNADTDDEEMNIVQANMQALHDSTVRQAEELGLTVNSKVIYLVTIPKAE